MSHDPVINWSRESRDKLKTECLLFREGDGYQTWQRGNLWWGKLTHNVRWSSDHVITWSHLTNWQLNISLSARSVTTKHGRLGTYGERKPAMESHNTLTMQWCVVTRQSKSVTYPFWQGLWPWNLVNSWFIIRWVHPWSQMFLMKLHEVTWQTKNEISPWLNHHNIFLENKFSEKFRSQQFVSLRW